MFSGIVEASGQILKVTELDRNSLIRIVVARPMAFDDIKSGDSIAVDGVCLTVEEFSATEIQFALAAETLKVTNFESVPGLKNRVVNLERSLRMGDRVHGHFVAGHVDAAARVTRVESIGGTVHLAVEIPKTLLSMVWKKGSWAVNGVSLTVNSVDGGVATHALIPETVQRTNLGLLKAGDLVNVEADTMARAFASIAEAYFENKKQVSEM